MPAGKIGESETFTTAEALKQIGRSRATVFRWMRDEEIEDVRRDYRGYRIWTTADIQRYRDFASHKTEVLTKRRS